MAMMETVRGATESSTMKAFLIIIATTFVFWGIGNQGPTSSVVAEVNGDRITDTQFRQVLRQEANRRSRNLSNDELSALRQQVLGQIIQRKVAIQEAENLGVEISDAEVAFYIRQYEVFRDESDKFSFDLYERHLKRLGLTKGKFQEDIREMLVIQRLAELAELAIQVSTPEIEAAYIEENSSYTLSFIRIREADVKAQIEVTDEEIAALEAVSPDRIEAAYRANFDARYKVPRKAVVRTIVQRLDLDGAFEEDLIERLEKIAAEAADGADFDALARRWSEDGSATVGGLLSEQIESEMNPAVAEAIFAVGAGQVTVPVETAVGFQILKVESITEAIITPLEDVSADLARELIIQERAPVLARELAEQNLTSWKTEGQAPISALLMLGLAPESSGEINLSASSIPKLGRATGLMAAAETAAEGDVLPEVYNISGDYVIAQVTDRTEANMDVFDIESGEIAQRLLMQKRLSFFSSWLDDLVARADVVRYL